MKLRNESRSDGIPSEANSPRTYMRRRSLLHSPFGSGDNSQKDNVDKLPLQSLYGSPPKDVQDMNFYKGEITGNGGSHKVGSSVGAKMD
ncbi:hypothetical protein Tco_0100681, partial [Tanacetum coccineum]